MNTIPVSKIEVLEDFPVVEQWLQNIKEYLKKDINEDKLQFFHNIQFRFLFSKSRISLFFLFALLIILHRFYILENHQN